VRLFAASTLILSISAPAAIAENEEKVKIQRSGSLPSRSGPEDYFTGKVRIDAPFAGTEPARVGGATVTFEPGARTAWHTHPLGQTLIVTQGRGLDPGMGDPIQEMNQGDIVWIPEGRQALARRYPRNRHDPHRHCRIPQRQQPVDWMEKVSDEQYRQ